MGKAVVYNVKASFLSHFPYNNDSKITDQLVTRIPFGNC